MQRVELKKNLKKPTLVSCPEALEPKWLSDGRQNGIFLNKETIASFFNIKVSKQPLWFTENIVFLGRIERNIDFEKYTHKENV